MKCTRSPARGRLRPAYGNLPKRYGNGVRIALLDGGQTDCITRPLREQCSRILSSVAHFPAAYPGLVDRPVAVDQAREPAGQAGNVVQQLTSRR